MDMDTSASHSPSVASVGYCPKKRTFSSTNGGHDPKKKMSSIYDRLRKPEPSRVRDFGGVISERSSSVVLKSIVCTPLETVEVLQSDDLRQVCNDDNAEVQVDSPSEKKMTDHMIGEEFGDLLARLNRVGPSMQHRLKRCEESIVCKDEEIVKLKNELKDEKAKGFNKDKEIIKLQNELKDEKTKGFSKDTEILNLRNDLKDEKAKVYKLQRVADNYQQRADDCDVEKESALLREKLLYCEFDVLKAKYVEKDKMITYLERELENVNKVGRAKHEELEEEITCLRDNLARLDARNSNLMEVIEKVDRDRWWLITEGFSYVFDKLRKSVEFLQPYGIVRSLLLKSKYQDGLIVGYDLCSQGFGVDSVPGYDPNIDRKLEREMNDLDTLVFPYLRRLAANADKSLDVIRAIDPDSGYAS